MQGIEYVEAFAASRGIGVGLAGLIVTELWLRQRPPFIPTPDEVAVVTRHPKAECRITSCFSRLLFEIRIDGEMASRARTEAMAWTKAIRWINDAWMRDESPPVIQPHPPTLSQALGKIAESSGASPESAKAAIMEILRGHPSMYVRQISLTLWGQHGKSRATLQLLRQLKKDGLVSRDKTKYRTRWSLKDAQRL